MRAGVEMKLLPLGSSPRSLRRRGLAVTPDLLDESVDDGTAPADVFAANEHPVFVTQLGGPDGVFGEVVVELDLAVDETLAWSVAPQEASGIATS